MTSGIEGEFFARKRLSSPSAQHPREIGIDSSDLGAKADRRNSGRCVRTDAVEPAESFDRLWPSMLGNRTSRFAQPQRTRIVSKARPCSEKDIRLGPRQILNGRPQPNEFIELWNDTADLGLLEHDLGYKNLIRILGPAPRKVPCLS